MDFFDEVYNSVVEAELARRVPEWDKLERSVQGVISHHATGVWREYSHWWNDARSTQNGRKQPIEAFVSNYVVCVIQEISPDTRASFGLGLNATETFTKWGNLLKKLAIGS